PLLADGATAAGALARREAPDGGVADAACGAATELEALLGELPDTRELPADAARGALRRTADDLTGLRATPPPAALAAASEVATREAGGELAARVDGADAGGVNTLQRFTDGTQLAQSFHGKSAPLPMHEPGLFAERLNQQVAVMVSQHASHARLAVNPAELGPVEVRVSVVGDEATIQLIATHAATREALEEALPRLRAAFADGGIALGDAAVFSQTPERQAGGRGEAGDAGHAARQHAGEPASEPVMQPLRTVRLGLVDAFV
ncbi:MAG: flagellar hook-length control protein FliK, partial [Gammaproteobacteria bacterium]